MATFITTSGNLADDPTTGTSDGGVAWARMTVLRNDRYQDRDGNWQDGPTQSYRVACFRRLAENVGVSLAKGDRVTISGRLTVSQYTDKDGNLRRSDEIRAENVAASLERATVAITRNPKAETAGTEWDTPEEPAF